MSKIMLVTWKAMFVMLVTAMAVVAADYCYKLTLPEKRLGALGNAEFRVARSSIPPNCTMNPWTGKMTCHSIPKKQGNASV
jgi:hypothetical protein